ncbi:soluble scavenger receptor cysteine-rich domain-containing protein SSC5D-like [Neolamprologus brichardi]|uniref:soluble scavenger receptor cysteine-rich domain-containing protein SSC5D-like n=1 Tax=Neolamprologus brichardi TaxID=32507 RepID=UPI0016436FAB|nr:soluble scavenger receptor cysteine-rich domain-containing protein SSC5D-like [Neolamprologus brichardi]
MAVLGATLCAVLMVTLVTAKPVHLKESEDSPKSSESSESSSSEETTTNGRSSQETLESNTPDATENNPLDATPLPSADAGPSLATSPADPQTSADPDALQLVPDPSHTAMSVDVSLDVPNSGPTKDSVKAVNPTHILPNTHPSGLSEAGVVIGTIQPQVITTYQGSTQGVTPPFPTCVIQPTPTAFSTAPPLVLPIGTTLDGGPVCFTFQVTTAEPDPPRGDSI